MLFLSRPAFSINAKMADSVHYISSTIEASPAHCWCGVFFFFFFTFLVAAPRPVHSLAESLAGLTMTLSLTAVGCHFHCSFCQRHVNKGSHVDAVNRMCHGLRTMITDGFFHHQLDGISLTMHLLLVYMWKVHLHPSLS